MSTTTRTTLGVGALFLGGLLGGLLGGALFGGGSERTWGAPPERVVFERDEELVEALRALTRELQVRGADDAPQSAPREALRDDGSTVSADLADVVTALERLTTALERSPAAGGGGIGVTPLALPATGARPDRLSQFVGRDWKDFSREYRLWTYQQVLDHFGKPDEIQGGGTWLYELQQGGDTRVYTFKFVDGYLAAIYD